MKKRLAALMLALLMLLSACGAKHEPPPAAEILPAAPIEAEEPVQEPLEEPQPRAAVMLQNAQAADAFGVLYYVPNEVVEQRCDKLVMFGDLLLALQYRYNGLTTDTVIYAIDIYSGETVAEATFKSADTTEVQVCGDKLVLLSHMHGTASVLDETLALTAEYIVAEEEWCSFYVDEAVEKAYCFDIDTGLRIVDLESGEEELLLEEARSLFTNTRCGDSISFSYVDSETLQSRNKVLDLRSGTIEDVPFDGVSYHINEADGMWVCNLSGEDERYLMGQEPISEVVLSGLPELQPETKHVLVSDYRADGSRTCTLYEADGTFISSYEQDAMGYFVGDLVWAEPYGGYFFTACDEMGTMQLQFWDLEAPAAGEDLVLLPHEAGGMPQRGSAVSESLYVRAEELSARYGVTIRIAEQCGTEFADYFVEQNFDAAMITAGLDELETALSAYPDGFFEQLRFAEYRSIEISLGGTLTPRNTGDGNGFTSFSAFVEQRGSRHLMVFDLDNAGMIEQTCYHEFSHIIDERLDFYARYRDDSSYSEDGWAAFNPQDFDYAYDYNELPDNFYNDGYDYYFIDLYSRTYPTEDRGRIMEYAMAGCDWYFEEGCPRREKLAYYAACIREAFDTTGWEETTVWEQPLMNG